MKYCYFNAGFAWAFANDDYQVLDGEVLFDHEATTEELIVAFPGYAVAAKQQKLDEVNTKYDIILNDLGIKYSLAAGSDGTTVTTKQTAIQNQILAKISEKATERSAILND